VSPEANKGGGDLPPPPRPRWQLSEVPDPEMVEGLAAELRLPRPLCALLVVRGIHNSDEAKAFLRPLITSLHPPEELTDLPKAVSRIARAIKGGEVIFVHGDYDVDGMAGTTLLTRWIRELGGDVVPFIPHRLRDGYDLGPRGVREAGESGATLLITVDSGILAHDAVAQATDKGMDVVVTDHHTPGDTLPPALAVLNPNRADCSYPNKGLCGAGVAYKLCQGLAEAFHREQEELHPLLSLVALATVADLVPLTGENRTLVRFGLRALAQTRNPGLDRLMHVAGVNPQEVDAGTIGFVLAPRLNAVGRLSDSRLGLRLLLTEDVEEAERLAEEAEALNKERQATDRRTLEEALARLKGRYDPDRDFGLVIAGEGWHPGVVGIVASRIAERVHRPTILVAMEGEKGRGSARSIPGFHLLDAIRAAGEHLERFGGHRQAAGLDVTRDNLPSFTEAFQREAREALEGEDLRPLLRVDLEVGLDELTEEVHKYLEYLGPHGMGNPRPVFLARGVGLQGPARVVGSNHLKLVIKGKGGPMEGIGFGMSDRIPPESLANKPLDVAFQLHMNEFRGRRTLQARLKDLRPQEPLDASRVEGDSQ
jgi:single-stranded-DNA-specific exonuclease